MKTIDYEVLEKGPSKDGARFDNKWWLVPKADRANSLWGVVKQIAEYDGKRQTQIQISNRLYGNANLMGMNGLSYSKVTSAQSAVKDRISYNVVQSAIDTITAKIAKNKPKPLFLTSGGDFAMQRKAKKLDKFVDGVFYENEAYKLGNLNFRDGAIGGDGFVHVFPLFGRVKFERVMASELYTDWVDSFYGNPTQMHRVKNMDRGVLIAMLPGQKSKIMDANSSTYDLAGAYQNVADQITVVESWHLPSGPDASDGMHCITIQGETLFEEKWEKDFFPFAQFSWNKRPNGFFGQGLAEQIQNIQLEINKLLWVIQRSMHLAGSFKILLENGSKIVKEHLNNDIGAIVTYTGAPPQYVTPPIVPPEIYQHLMTLKNAAFEQAGISQLSAASLKPAGLNSGKALREYNDIESDRFMTVGQAYERFFMDLAKLTVATARDLYAEDKKLAVKVPGKKFIETIKWSDVDMEDDEYILKIFPVSALPNDPAGRLQTVQEYSQAGFISPRAARRLLDFPDLEHIEDLQNAEEEYLGMILDKIVDKGEFTAPEPFDDLTSARELALQYYSQGKMNNLDEDKLELLRRFMSQLDVLAQKAMPPAPPQMPGGPQAVPVPPPQSDLLQNAPGAV